MAEFRRDGRRPRRSFRERAVRNATLGFPPDFPGQGLVRAAGKLPGAAGSLIVGRWPFGVVPVGRNRLAGRRLRLTLRQWSPFPAGAHGPAVAIGAVGFDAGTRSDGGRAAPRGRHAQVGTAAEHENRVLSRQRRPPSLRGPEGGDRHSPSARPGHRPRRSLRQRSAAVTALPGPSHDIRCDGAPPHPAWPAAQRGRKGAAAWMTGYVASGSAWRSRAAPARRSCDGVTSGGPVCRSTSCRARPGRCW